MPNERTMSAAHVNGTRKRRRVEEEPFTVQHGLTLLLNAGGGALTAVLKAATRSFEQSLEQESADSVQSPEPLPSPVHHSDSNGSGQRRNAGDVDEEDWHNGQQQQQPPQPRNDDNTHAVNIDNDSSRHTNGNRAGNNNPIHDNNTTHNDHTSTPFSPPTLPLTTAPPSSTTTSTSSTQPSPRVKIEPVSTSKPPSTPVQKNGTGSKKKQEKQRTGVGGGSSATTEDERDVKPPPSTLPRKSTGAANNTPAAKRSLYAPQP